MGTPDTVLLLLVGVADFCLMVHLHRRRQRRTRRERVMRSLRNAIRREVRVKATPVPATSALVLQQAS